MRVLRELAEQTPPSRERYVDLLRAVTIVLVVLGHWLVSVITHNEQGQLAGHAALESMTWMYPFTWLVQVMPLFFIAGGYANAASLAAHRDRGGHAITWLQNRGARLLRPTTTFLVVLATVALVAQPLGADREMARLAIWFATIQLWFLSAYLAVVLLTPLMYWLHGRFGWGVVVVLVVLVTLGDVARFHGHGDMADGGYIYGWLVIHQIGFFWRDGRLPFRPRVWAPLLFGGLAAVMALTLAGPYPVSMVDVPGREPHNASPPTVALLASTAFQLGLVMMLHGPAQRWLRQRPWQAVVGTNMVILTIFLWHMCAVLLLVGLLNAVGALPTPAAGTVSWWIWRLPWFLMLAVILAGLVAVFGRIEMRGTRQAAASRLPPWLTRALTSPVPCLVLTLAAFAGAAAGLISNNVAPARAHYRVGMPLGGLLAYLAGAALLRLLRSARTVSGAEPP
ncbi:acyltransferase [Pseudofrankia sp. BMG5.36]|uniref:acyltransferase family protein n=1 Tax=Pseudofrankia sp. BMG5.36 TaxID=1834512 RepID=UPI0008D95B2B|nr:acyltransferase [Pseudofrankia sp. BMG5.36]OHV44930.1 acyltransferase [Pseudofrankia sp. BMG5.36]